MCFLPFRGAETLLHIAVLVGEVVELDDYESDSDFEDDEPIIEKPEGSVDVGSSDSVHTLGGSENSSDSEGYHTSSSIESPNGSYEDISNPTKLKLVS